MKKVKKSQNKILVNAVVEADPRGGFSAFVPSMPGCITEANTMAELETNLQEAIELWQESFFDNKPKIKLVDKFELAMPMSIMSVSVNSHVYSY
jgi:predicted RNase H-like HicB family nuclease